MFALLWGFEWRVCDSDFKPIPCVMHAYDYAALIVPTHGYAGRLILEKERPSETFFRRPLLGFLNLVGVLL